MKEPFARQNLNFDFEYIEGALAYIEEASFEAVGRLAQLPAVDHIRRHMKRFGPGEVPPVEEVVRDLIPSSEEGRRPLPELRAAVDEARRCIEHPGEWLCSLLGLLPDGHCFCNTTLYFTYGYDVGVVSGKDAASINLAHHYFREHPACLKYFFMHELHHAGYLYHQELPKLGEVRSRKVLGELVRGLTQLEGLGVFVPCTACDTEAVLGWHPDYAALTDEQLMAELEEKYWELYRSLEQLPEKLNESDIVEVLTAFGSPHKLFHLVGARFAERIDRRCGRKRLVQTITEGPGAFVALARQLAGLERD